VRVYNTHSHFDHVGGNHQFKRVGRAVPSTSITCAPFALEVIATPGHSSDSVCFFERSRGWLFSGDTVYYGPIFLTWPDSSISSFRRSVRLLSSLPIKKIFPGHNTFRCSRRCLDRIARESASRRRLRGRLSLAGRLALVAPK
jgi:glyoxylase-like metal-dependent hydrolase (beta-lactamase superfamily II)